MRRPHLDDVSGAKFFMQGLEFAIAVFDILKLTLGHDFEFDFVGELIGGER